MYIELVYMYYSFLPFTCKYKNECITNISRNDIVQYFGVHIELDTKKLQPLSLPVNEASKN